ncbi:MAG: hypothetical protein ACPGWR_05145 [Ardenticatenaceae bacterium]
MFDLVIHATHEAGVKVGGIGAVLSGLLGCGSYKEGVKRTVLVGNYDADDQLEWERLRGARNGLTIRYHTREGIVSVPGELVNGFHEVQVRHGVSILYGTRKFGGAEHEVLLVDSREAKVAPIHELKAYLYARHGLHSSRYEGEAEFDQFMGGAMAQIDALRALVGADSQGAIFIAHEWLGLPALFAAECQLPGHFRTVFYAHETATVRPVIEHHPGHDLRYYNAQRIGGELGLSLEEVFGDQNSYFKHALLRAALSLDGVFAVGDLVKEELQFLAPPPSPPDPSFLGTSVGGGSAKRGGLDRPVDLVYNGVPSTELSVEQKQRSKKRLQLYAQRLHDFTPTWVFSHVTRLIPSKGIWRDIRVMERLDEALAKAGETAIFYLLSTVQPAGRRSQDVYRWEQEYGWPVHHRSDNGDLIAYEWDYYQSVEHFNGHARASRIVFVNQFGWSRDRCGARMPAEMGFMDLRYGTDVEFGQSIYEPFGIAQVEPLSFGALCVLSTACGCLGFIRDAGGLQAPNIVVGDYLYLPDSAPGDLPSILTIDQSLRDTIEAQVADQVAAQIMARLPRTPHTLQQRLTQGYQLGAQMSWNVVARDYLLPALRRIALS